MFLRFTRASRISTLLEVRSHVPLLKQCFSRLKGLHPRVIAEGFEAAKEKALEVLEEVKVMKEMDRETLIHVARTSLRTKVHAELADLLTEVRNV